MIARNDGFDGGVGHGDILIFTAANPPGFREPAWKRRIIYDQARDLILVPAAMLGDERAAEEAAAQSGLAAVAFYEDHCYLPLAWVEEQDPAWGPHFRKLEAAVAREMEEGS